MIIQAQCQICKQTFRANGQMRMYRAVENHFVLHHTERWLDYIRDKQRTQATISSAQDTFAESTQDMLNGKDNPLCLL